jgi:transmembrane 9 superfamily protein 2/4
LYNHLVFKILYHESLDAGGSATSRIVGFEVEPYSVRHSVDDKGQLRGCDDKAGFNFGNAPKQQKVDDDEDVIFTYDVVYEPSDITWASRWDTYLIMTDKEVHWFSIVNSLMIVLFLSGMIAMIMLRTLRRDISRYNDLETAEEAAEETGWKLVHGDVFRAPPHASWLAVAVGTGTQILSMTVVTVTFASLGFLSPANRGGLTTAALFLFVFSAVFNGYASARLYKSFKKTNWRMTTFRAALTFPGIVSIIFLTLNFMVWGQKSSGAVPFGSMLALIFLWFGVSVPLTFIGSYVGYKREPIEDPVRTNKIPRQVPEQPWYMNMFMSVLVGGILPFGAVFMELFFILGSVWKQQVYYLFGILGLVFIILMITCAEITIVLAYFHLCSEDYKWWWRSFITSGSSAFYLLAYSMFYFFTRLDITKFVPALMYFGYMFIVALAFFALTGTVGFYACFLFIRKIYGSVKID